MDACSLVFQSSLSSTTPFGLRELESGSKILGVGKMVVFWAESEQMPVIELTKHCHDSATDSNTSQMSKQVAS